MRILILNWRDIKNPTSGGAEVLTHEVAKRFVAWGHQVVQFSSSYKGAKSQEIIDGVTIIRKGNPDTRFLFYSVHFLAFLFYQQKAKGKFDVVIDEIHGIPFFIPWYVREKKFAFICEVGGELWLKSYGPLFGLVGLLVEKIYLRMIYKNILYLAISKSTKNDLVKNGVREDAISVLPMGFNVPESLPKVKKEETPTLLFVGRITIAKGIEDVLYALSILKKSRNDIKLWVVGRGKADYVKRIKKMIVDLEIEKNVTFLGFVSEKDKFSLMARAHILIHSSIKEGFGLTIPEAGFVGTPVVAYNSLGLRDVVMNGKNGVLLSENSPENLASAIMDVIADNRYYARLCNGARAESKKYNWDNTAKFMLSYIEK